MTPLTRAEIEKVMERAKATDIADKDAWIDDPDYLDDWEWTQADAEYIVASDPITIQSLCTMALSSLAPGGVEASITAAQWAAFIERYEIEAGLEACNGPSTAAYVSIINRISARLKALPLPPAPSATVTK